MEKIKYKFEVWHLIGFLPVIFSILGGIIGFVILTKMKKGEAIVCLYMGIGFFSISLSALGLGLGFLIIYFPVAIGALVFWFNLIMRSQGLSGNNPYGYGNYLYNQGKYEEAINAYDNAIRNNPNDRSVIPWKNKGLALYNLGKYQEAINAYDKVIEIYNGINESAAQRYANNPDFDYKLFKEVMDKSPPYKEILDNKDIALKKLHSQ